MHNQLREVLCGLWGIEPPDTDIDYLCFLLDQKVLTLQLRHMKKSIQLPLTCMFTELWTNPLALNVHQQNYISQTTYAIIKLCEQFPEIINGGHLLMQEPWYTGYRADLGVVFPPFNEANHVLVAVELGTTQIVKVVEGLTDLPLLRELWHFPGDRSYFIWRKGYQWKEREKITLANPDFLSYSREWRMTKLKEELNATENISNT